MNDVDSFRVDQYNDNPRSQPIIEDNIKSKKKQMINKSKAKIVMLDNTNEYFDLKKDDTGKMLYTRVCDFMRLEEKDYFGLMFMNNENTKVNHS
jgi:hypothetical protein